MFFSTAGLSDASELDGSQKIVPESALKKLFLEASLELQPLVCFATPQPHFP
jgi:hypothetical protein